MEAAICEWRGFTAPAFMDQLCTYGEDDAGALRAAALAAEGSFAAIRRNTDGTVTVVTDHSGSIAVYYGVSADRVHAGFHARDVAAQCGRLALDPISVVDFVVNQTVCYPHTLFQGVFVAPPGAISRLGHEGIRTDAYFAPQEAEERGTATEWGERLRSAVQRSLELGLSGQRRVKVLFSGGEDSRAVVCLMPSALECTLVTFADAENREVRLARRAAAVLGRPFVFVPRPAGFYRRDLCARANLVSGAFDVRNTHAWGIMGRQFSDADAIVGGYNADSLFKSIWMRNRVRGWGGLGPERLSRAAVPSTVQGEDPDSYPAWISRDVALAVAERRRAHGERLRAIRPRSAASWDTLWPQGAHRLDYAHFLAVRAIGPRVVEPFLDSQVYRLASVMPDCMRVDRPAFRAAFNPVMGLSKWLPSSSGRIPALGGYLGRAVELAIKGGRASIDLVAQKTTAFRGGRYPEQGAWNSDCFGFDVKASDHLTSDGIEQLCGLLRTILHGGMTAQDTTWHAINALPRLQRSRLIQVGCLLDRHPGNRAAVR